MAGCLFFHQFNDYIPRTGNSRPGSLGEKKNPLLLLEKLETDRESKPAGIRNSSKIETRNSKPWKLESRVSTDEQPHTQSRSLHTSPHQPASQSPVSILVGHGQRVFFLLLTLCVC